MLCFAIGLPTGYGLDEKGGRISSPGRMKNFLFSTSSRPALGLTQPPIQWVPGALSPGVKQPGCEADHSPPTSETYRRGLDWMIRFIGIHTTRDYRQYSAVAALHNLQFTVTHALGFSVFSSCILATDL
jgi:hypothetical protein